MSPARSWLAAAAMLAAGGCAVGPDYHRPEVPVAAAYKEAGAWKEAEPRDAQPRGKWWEVFGDAQLNALVGQVEVSNQNVLAAEARLRQALALARASGAALYPEIDANASITKSRSPSGAIGGTTAGRIITNRSASLAASWEPDVWGRIRRTAEAGEASAQASAADLAAVRLSAQATLAQSYFQLRVLDLQKRLLDDIVAALGQALKLTQNRYAAGVAAKVDVVQADAQLKSTQAQVIELGAQRAQLEHAIAVLLGKTPADFELAQTTADTKLPAIPPGVPSALLERRPDIAAAERRVAAANAQIGVARSAFFPSFTISAADGFRSASASQWFTAPTHFWSFGPALAQSLFDAGLRRAQSDAAVAAYDASVATYRQAALAGFQEVEDQLALLRVLEAQAKVQEAAVRAARESVALTTNQYRAGLVTYINVVTVQASQLNNERTAAGILGQRLAAAVGLVKALGGGWDAASLAVRAGAAEGERAGNP